jgi:predicted nucleotidyltransferase
MAETINPIEGALRRIQQSLDLQEIPSALVGGLAVSTWTNPRTTRDVDIVVSTSADADAEGIVFALRSRGYSVATVLDHEPSGRMATARLLNSAEPGVFVDLLFASSGIEPEIVRDARRLEVVEGLTLAVAAIPHLMAMKLLARNDRERPQDWDDLRSLHAASQPGDVDRVRQLLFLIEVRGFNRGRRLVDDFEKVLEEIRR